MRIFSLESTIRIAQIPITEQLQWLFGSADPQLPPEFDESHRRNVREHYKKYSKTDFSLGMAFIKIMHFRFKKESSSLTTVRSSIQSAFLDLDEDLSRGAMPDASGRVCKMSVNIAASGSCELQGLNHLYSLIIHIFRCIGLPYQKKQPVI